MNKYYNWNELEDEYDDPYADFDESVSAYHIFRSSPTNMLGKRLQIVHIDDSKDDSDLFSELLREEGGVDCVIQSFRKPSEGKKYIQNTLTEGGHIDLIVLDINMPEQNGKNVLVEVKEILGSRGMDIPTIIHSSLNSDANILEVCKNHAHAFFQKPVNVSGFTKLIGGGL